MASCALSALCGQAMRSWMNAPLFGLFVTSAIAQSCAVVIATALKAGPTRRPDKELIIVPTPARRRDPARPAVPRPRPEPHAVSRGAWKLLTSSGPRRLGGSAWSVGCARALVRRDKLANAGGLPVDGDRA